MKYRYLFTACVTVVFLTACNSQPGSQTLSDTMPKNALYGDTSFAGNFTAASGIKFDSLNIAIFLKSHPLFNKFSGEMSKFYQTNKYNYVWYDKEGLTEFSNQLVSKITTLDQQGVNLSIPYN